jgi:glycosyltransferase involved in cell wall biosynthesis
VQDKNCIFFTRIMPGVNTGGGGRRRTNQLYETINTVCPVELVSAPKGDKIGGQNLEKLRSTFRIHLLKHFIMDGEYNWWHPDKRKAVFFLRNVSREWIKRIDGIERLDLAIVEDPIFFKPLVRKLKKLGIPIIASCQNIETLCTGQVVPKKIKKMLYRELDTFALCDLVISISREEDWLLKSFNINSFYFPYFPSGENHNRLLNIRENRKKSEKRNIILLGSVGNLATREGMLQVIRHWREQNLTKSFGKLWVAGYRTHVFMKQIRSDDHIEFLGQLPNNELDERLNAVKACICYQEKGGGALTRICEMLIAGVPVLANPNAARSYYNLKGLIEFQNLDDLERAVKQVDEMEGHIPVPPEPDASFLVSEIKKIVG